MRAYENQPAGTVDRARLLRRDATEAEKRLWRGLRDAFPSMRFRRQVPIGPYFADFLSFGARLVIEVDGGQHADAADYDARRNAFLKREGFTILRVWNNDVLSNLEGALTQVSFSLREKEGARPAQPGGKDEGDVS